MFDRDNQVAKYLLIIFFAFIVIRNAWISDDAYITFRTIENFLSGYGLGYNPYIRVQAYTHPAWMILLTGIYSLERLFVLSSPGALYLITIFVSVISSTVTLYILINKIARNDLWASVLFTAVLTLSRAFIDYSTSGLENPLTHLLLALFLWIYLENSNKVFYLALTSCLLVITRQDAILLVLPALLYLFWQRRDYRKDLKAYSLGFIPLVLWEFFSTFYYGFPFPNTAYAKLNTGIQASLLMQQGLDYLLNSIHWDPLILLVTGFAGVTLLHQNGMEDIRKSRSLYLGVFIYLLYVVKIGGDFMSGRFLTAPLLLSVAIIARSSLSQKNILIFLSMVSLLGVFSLRSTLLDPRVPAVFTYDLSWDGNEIADERSMYFANARKGIYLGFVESGFRDPAGGSGFAGSKWYYTRTRNVMVGTAIGRIGYAKGPNVLIVDNYALVDPLLARLPTQQKKWRIGHFGRDIPPGCLETLESGVNQIVDPNLSLYYKELSVLVQGPIWDWERLIKIWKFNTGQYDNLLKSYLISQGE